jgi:hypothetical protein
MYERKAHQATFFEDATLFSGVRLNPENRWVRMSRLIPWAVFEERYAALFSNPWRVSRPSRADGHQLPHHQEALWLLG